MILPRILESIIAGLRIDAGDLCRGPEHLREPLKAVLSVLLAVLIATAMHLPDILWAALSGFLVMRSTLGESLARAVQRSLGTAGGALCGLIIARWVSQDIGLQMVALFTLIWLAIYQGSVTRARYAWALFGATAAVVLVAALGTPVQAPAFAAVRAVEVVIGSFSAVLVAAVFEAFGLSLPVTPPAGQARPGARLTPSHLNDEAWLARQWPIIIHAAQTATAVSLLPLVWRLFQITDYLQTAISAFIVMIVPLNVIEGGGPYAVYERMLHRAIGCLLGAVAALLALHVTANDGLLWVLCLAAGVWIGFHIQSGRGGIAYLGTQFAFAFLTAFVQGPGPATSVEPPLTRLLGIAIGVAMTSLVILAWPSSPSEARSRPD